MGIKHIEFWVFNLQRSLGFYQGLFGILGWKLVDENGFSDGSTKMYFIEQPVTASRSAGPRHVCFLAASKDAVDKVGEYLRQSNAEIIRGPLESRYENRESYTVDFKDPDGYILEVATKSKTV